MKHLSLYVIATVNTAPTVPPKPATRPDREKRRFFRAPSFFRAFKSASLESREAAA